MKSKTILGSLFLAVLLLAGCFQPSSTVKIGVIGTLTGIGAFHGQQELKGLELAKDEINAAGGINGKRIELIVEDSRAEPGTAVNALNKLIQADGLKFVIGDSWNSTTIGLVPIANQNRVLLFSPWAMLNSLDRDDYFFRTVPLIQPQMQLLADYAYNDMNIRRVGILRQDTPFGMEHAVFFREAFEALGGEIVGEEHFAITAADVKTEISKIKAQNPDAIFNLHATGPMQGVLMKQALEQGMQVKWISSYGTENQPLLSDYADIADGMVYPYMYDSNSDSIGVQAFIHQYQQRYNELPDITAANAYDALKLLAQAIEKVGENPDAVKAALLQIQNYDGASGTISFDQNGNADKPIFIKALKDGQFVVVKR